MPLFTPPPSAIVIDEDGYISIAGTLPFKVTAELQEDGVTWRFTQSVKHPTVGEVQIAFTDHVPE